MTRGNSLWQWLRMEAACGQEDVTKEAVTSKDFISGTVLDSETQKQVFWLKPLANCGDFFHILPFLVPM